jgi:4-hydroxybenzoyl-CoA thioesterase
MQSTDTGGTMQDKDQILFRFLAQPSDAAVGGSTVQAGSVLEWIDKAGYACAVGWAGATCVTAYVGNVNFSRPIAPGELVEVKARVTFTGRTSIHVNVAVSSADPRSGEFEHATECILVFVSVDAAGRPKAVPAWSPRSIGELELSAGAEERIAARAAIHEEMKRQTYSAASSAPITTLRFLAAPSAANFGGKAHGGTVMRWIDESARTCATVWNRRPTLAAYSGGIHFYRPVNIGDLVEVESRLIYTSDRSMHVAVHVRSGSPETGEMQLTTQCMSILVTKGPDGHAVPVRQFRPETEEDHALSAHAQRLIQMRAALVSLPIALT